MSVILFDRTGPFAENKDLARDIRLQEIIPTLNSGQDVVIDFDGVQDATQSFVHALISDLFRLYGREILDRVKFKNCSETVKKVIEIVTDYMQES